GGAFTNALKNGTSDLALVANVGGQAGNFSGRVTLNYLGGYPILGVANQSNIEAFKTVDLFLGYTLKHEGLPNGVLLTLNVDNVFDEDPPYINTSTGYTNGGTLGRLVSVGLRARF
ncbi:MAG TPA: hypothetical protein VGN89_04005, partial [Phenylobacterium sp.]|nr:hypothetical protein [Phenylobacterium sp.]